jgi:serine/threonine protein kinase
MASLSDPGIEGIGDLVSLDIDGSAIFRAREIRHHRHVAIKILDPHGGPLAPARRFDPRRRPLHTFANSDGVVPAYRSGTTKDGDRFVMMPFYRAGSLADQLAHGSTPWHASAELIVRIAEILAPGHAAGVVLTGIKPSSILLADATTPLLAVYGMATRRYDDGRPNYRAPELGRGAAPTSASDVYSLGLTLAALIAGRPPEGSTRSSTLLAPVETAAPKRIVDVVARAIEEDPAVRHRSAGEFAVVLRAALGGDQIPDQPPPPGTAAPFDLDEILPPTAPPMPPISTSLLSVVGPGGAAAAAQAAATALATEEKQEGEEEEEEGVIDLTTIDRPSSATPGPTVTLAAPQPPPPAPEPSIDALDPSEGVEDLPFRAFDRQHVVVETPGRFVDLVDTLQVTWLQIRRSLGALLAAATLVIIAGIVVMLVLEQRRPATTVQGGANPTFTTAQEEGSATTFAPTSVAPALLEPPATQTTTSRTRATSTRPVMRGPSTSTASPTSPVRDPSTSVSTPRSSIRPTSTTRPRSTSTTARPPVSVTAAAPTTKLTARPLAIDVSASRLRRTSARIGVTSDTCVTTSFSYAPHSADSGGGTVNGGKRCSDAHTLNLGRVTAALRPGTTYSVQVTATDESGRSTRSQVSFTTLS